MLLKTILKSLKELNWHIREECLVLLQCYFADFASELEISAIEKLLLEVFPLLDDSKPKVRFLPICMDSDLIQFLIKVKLAAIDTLATALKSWNKDRQLHNFIYSIVEQDVYQTILKRIEGADTNSIGALGFSFSYQYRTNKLFLR